MRQEQLEGWVKPLGNLVGKNPQAMLSCGISWLSVVYVYTYIFIRLDVYRCAHTSKIMLLS